MVSIWGRRAKRRASEAMSRTAHAGRNPKASSASTSPTRSRRPSTNRVAATTTTFSELPTTIPDTGTSTRASRGRIPRANTVASETPRPREAPTAVIHPRPARRGSRLRAASPAAGTIATTQAHAQTIGVSPSSRRVRAHPASTSWATARTVASASERSRPRRRRNEMPATTTIGTIDAASPHQPMSTPVTFAR